MSIEAIAPTSEFRQHHFVLPPSVEQNREAWKVYSQVMKLHSSGLLKDSDLAACNRFLDDQEIGCGSACDTGLRPRIDCANGGKSFSDRLIDAKSRVRAVSDALGQTAFRLLKLTITHDASWRDIGKQLRIDHKTAKARAIKSIMALTKHYAMVDSYPRRIGHRVT